MGLVYKRQAPEGCAGTLRRSRCVIRTLTSARHAVVFRQDAGVSVCCSVVFFCSTLYCVYTVSCEEELDEK